MLLNTHPRGKGRQQADLCKVKAILVYIVNSKLARCFLSKKKNQVKDSTIELTLLIGCRRW